MVMKGKILLSEKMHTDRYRAKWPDDYHLFSNGSEKNIYLYIYRDRQIKNI